MFNFAQAALLHSLEGCVYTTTSVCKQRQLCHVVSDISTAPLARSLLALDYLLKMDDFIFCEQHSDLCGDKFYFSVRCGFLALNCSRTASVIWEESFLYLIQAPSILPEPFEVVTRMCVVSGLLAIFVVFYCWFLLPKIFLCEMQIHINVQREGRILLNPPHP